MGPEKARSLQGFGGRVFRQDGPAFVEILDSPSGDLMAVHLSGTHREMGRQYGRMLGDKILECWEVMKGVAETAGLPRDLLPRVGAGAWSHYSKHTSSLYKAELVGLVEGAKDRGVCLSTDMAETAAAFPDFSGFYRIAEMVGGLMGEPAPDMDHRWTGKDAGIAPTHCSAFMAWGSRTRDGKLYGSRNLDWQHDTGITAFKCITVFHPVLEDGEPGVPSATFGHLGVLGCMAGINAAGIALSEIGSFNARETFDGRLWHYVFREVLDRAKNLGEAVRLIDQGNYTQGYCFVVGCGDPHRYRSPQFAPAGVSVEVDSQHIEVFADDDPKERDAVWVDRDGKPVLVCGQPVSYGIPMRDATCRADTAFSATVRSGQATDNGPAVEGNSGDPREGETYKKLHVPMARMIQGYTEGKAFEAPGKERWKLDAGEPHPMTRDEAFQVCKMAGDNEGNIMSVFIVATDLRVALAFERGTGQGWTPAALAGYRELDLGPVFSWADPSHH